MTFEKFKEYLLKLIGSMLMEQDSTGKYTISLGRVSFWLLLIPALGIWIYGRGGMEGGEAIKDIAPNHFNMLLVLAGYNFGKKVTSLVSEFKDKSKSVKVEEEDGPG